LRGRVRERCWLPSAAAAYATALVQARGRPGRGGDTGVFVSVAGGLLRGDRLYVDVFDNKDPLLFYTDSVALGLIGWKGPFLLDVVWLTIAATCTALVLIAIGASRPTVVAGFISYPVLLTGALYYSGYSMLAGLAFIPLIAWLWMRHRGVLAGMASKSSSGGADFALDRPTGRTARQHTHWNAPRIAHRHFKRLPSRTWARTTKKASARSSRTGSYSPVPRLQTTSSRPTFLAYFTA
jgi:hypothetical protein